MAIDSTDPTGGLLREALDLVRKFASAPRGELDSLKSRAGMFVERYDADRAQRTISHRHRMAPDRAADQWILEIFRATETAIPREQLLQDFVTRYRAERNTKDAAGYAGPWLFVFECGPDDDGKTEVRPVVSAGVHPNSFATLCAEWLPKALDDAFLKPVLFEDSDLEGYPAPWFGGSPLFDRLLDAGRRFRGESDYWVNAVALPGARDGQSMGVFILHPNVGTLDDPVPPPNMRQDQRLLIVLALAWRQLEHQIKSLANVSEADRREMIQLLAPGLLHHEIGAEMRAIHGQASQLYATLRAWSVANADQPVLRDTALAAYSIGSHAQRLFAITDAFNNLDKRAQVEDTTLGTICQSLALLVHHRIGRAPSTDLSWDEALNDESLHTDAVLLTQAMLNIVNNALNAIAEGNTPPPRRIRIEPLPSDTKMVRFAIYNNGPPIPSHLTSDIFRRGYTTRYAGHGQGLYLARIVARYLGGEVATITKISLPSGFNVGFRFSFLRRLSADLGVAHAAPN